MRAPCDLGPALPNPRSRSGQNHRGTGACNYNQYYEGMHGKRKQYVEFIVNKYVPMLESIDYL